MQKIRLFFATLACGLLLQSRPALAQPAPIEPIDPVRVGQVKTMLPAAPKGLGDSYNNRTVWAKLAANPAYASTITGADALLTQTFPPFDNALYEGYLKNGGDRSASDAMVGGRYSWLPKLVWAECLQNRNRYMAKIEAVITSIINQPSWTLAAHDAGGTNFYGTKYTVDLAAAGVASNLGQALYLLDDKISPTLRQQVLTKLQQHVFGPILDTFDGKNAHWWLTAESNWNQVCLAGVVGAAVAALPDVTARAKFVTIGERYSQNVFPLYDNEGYDTEGLGYYNYGFSYHIVLRETVFQATGKKIDLFTNPKLALIATYGARLEIQNSLFPNIGDSRIYTTASPQILWYGSRVFKLGLVAYDTLTFFGRNGSLSSDVFPVFPNSASATPINPTPGAGIGIRSYFNTAGLLVSRPSTTAKVKLGVALQGGVNFGGHRHLDVGSYNVAVDNELMMGDPGGPWVYNADSFGPHRYDILTNSSYGHPVPVISGIRQRYAQDAKAQITQTTLTDAQDTFGMDITSAYFAGATGQINRTFVYNRQNLGFLKVEDAFNFATNQTIEEAITTRSAWRQYGNQIILTSGTSTVIATVNVPAGNNFTVRSEQIKDDPKVPAFTRIGITLTNPLKSGIVTITYTPVDPTPLAEGTYTVKAKHSGLVFDVGGSSLLNGTTVHQSPYYGPTAKNQHFKLDNLNNGHYTISAVHSGKPLGMAGESILTGASLAQDNYTGGPNQQFRLQPERDGYFWIVNNNSGLCLDVDGDNDVTGGRVIKQAPCNSHDDQKFYFTRTDLTGARIAASAEVNAETLVSIYPNPAQNEAVVRAKEGSAITVVNTKGQECLTMTATGELTTINISGLGNGLYIIRVQVKNQLESHKLLINR